MKNYLLIYTFLMAIMPSLGATRIVFLAGPDSHGYGTHDFEAGARYMASCLRAFDPEIETTVAVDDGLADLSGADAVILYCDGLEDHLLKEETWPQIDELQKNGTGIGFLHWACAAEKDGLGREMLEWVGGFYETYWSVNPQWDAAFRYLPPHPVTRGVVPFSMYGEWYFNMRFREETDALRPILTAVPPDHARMGKDGPNSGNPHVRSQTGKPEYLAWAFDGTGGRRGFALTGLHYYWNLGHPGLRKLLLNSCLWLAGREVPDTGIPVNPVSLEELESMNPAKPDDEWINRERSQWASRLEEWNSAFGTLSGPNLGGNLESASLREQLRSDASPESVLMDALVGENPNRARLAFELLMEEDVRPDILGRLGEVVLRLPAERQTWILHAMQGLGHPSHRDTVLQLSRDGSGQARVEAIRMLGGFGRTEDLPFLYSQSMVAKDEIATATTVAWREFPAGLADPYLNGMLVSCDTALQAKAIELVLAREQESSTEALLAIGLDPENPNAGPAIRAAGRLAPVDEATYRRFLRLFLEGTDSPLRRDWQMGIWELSQRQPDIGQAVQIIEDVKSGAPESLQRVLTGLGRKLGSLQ